VRYPAIDISTDDRELIYALLDDYAPSAVQERDSGLIAFFPSCAARDSALIAIARRYQAVAIDVPDGDWARRSQRGLEPVTVGRITIYPHLSGTGREPPATSPASLAIVITPSMGFGTGHHATTRLCLAALQKVDVRGRSVLDVGTGSGVLAIAASLLVAARVEGIDFDADAIAAARDNLLLNLGAPNVTFTFADLSTASLPAADVVTANLTGGLLVRSAPTLLAAIDSGGAILLSGVMTAERDDVVRAFTGAEIVWEEHEDEWVGLTVKKS
jgi:ribosomal protein L11 methyltransferase